MSTSSQEKIRKKIQALLAKTTENGASQFEALAALEKAKELMIQHMISGEDLTAQELKDQLIEVKVTVRNSNTIFNIPEICNGLEKAFDVQYYYHTGRNNIVYLFGMKDDIELATYFLQFITTQMFKSLHAYKKTEEYKTFKAVHGISGRRLSTDFTKGFISAINAKLYAIYRERNNFKGEGLMVMKADEIKKEFHAKFKIKYTPNADAKYAQIYNSGKETGDSIELVQGLKRSDHRTDVDKLDSAKLQLN